jgi:hypothetical protein
MPILRFSSPLLLLGLMAACNLPQASPPLPSKATLSPALPPAPAPTLSTTPQPSLTATPAPENVQDILDRCPTAAEIDSIDAGLTLGFTGDPTAGTLICRAADGSADLTLLQERAYQVLGIMQRLEFDQPLPWTGLSLYDWFTSNIDHINFNSSVAYSSCCRPPRTMNLVTGLFAIETGRWLQAGKPDVNVEGLMVLMIHEARHSDGHYHTCGPARDKTIAELGSFGVQYYTYVWLAYHSDPAFMTSGSPQPNLYREINRDMAIRFRMSSDAGNGPFCQEATITPGPSPTVP